MSRWLLASAFVLVAVGAAAQTPVVIRDGSTGAEKGTAGAPIRTDPTGSTTQPVSGTVTANAGTNLNTSLLVLDATVTGRFPAGSTPATGESNAVTISRVGAFSFIFNGATWDRWTGAVTQSGTWNVGTLTTITNVVHIDDNAGSLTVDGTVTTTPPANASTNVAQFGGTNVSTGTGAGGVGIPRVTVSNDSTVGLVAGTALVGKVGIDQTTPGTTNRVDVGVFPDNEPFNVAQVAGQTALQGDQNNVASATGAINTGPLGRYNATQPTLTDTRYNFLQLSSRGGLFVATGADVFHVTCDSGCTPGGSFGDNSAFTFGSSAINPTGYVVDDTATNAVAENSAGSARMTPLRVPYADLSKDSSALISLLASLAKTNPIGDTAVSGAKPGYYVRAGLAGNVVSQQNPLPVMLPDAPDPCAKRKGNVAISQTATTRQILGRPGLLIAICYARVVNATAEVVNELEGTGTNCGTSTLAVSGSTTAANGESLAANGGFSAGTGLGTISTTSVPGNDYCLGQSASARVSGHMTYVYYAP